MKYPLDERTNQEIVAHLVNHERAQAITIKLLTGLMIEAMTYIDEEEPWYQEAQKFLKNQQQLKVDHENRRFNEEHLKKQDGPVASLNPEIPTRSSQMPSVGNNMFDAMRDASLNDQESKFGSEMSERDLSTHFAEAPKLKKEKKKDFKEMSLEEINEWEKAQDNSNDIYKIKARVANLARGSGASLTPVGEMMVNTFVHVLKDLYDFIETIPDKNMKIQLLQRIRKHENMPGNLIAATKAMPSRK